MPKTSNGVKILAIETSCDETAIAVADFSGAKTKPKIKILANLISSQVKLHAKFGGVVPNLAQREHQRNLIPVLLTALKEAGLQNYKLQITNYKQIPKPKFQKIEKILEREPELLKKFKKYILPLAPPEIDAIAATIGPGLAPALWAGVNFARALALLWGKPLIPTNHMEGHLFSALLQKSGKKNSQLLITGYRLPALALLVSGGHTELVLARGYGKYKIIGETLDDAAGEAFDKTARILGLKYPGGAELSRLAETATKIQNAKIKNRPAYSGTKFKIKLPRPIIGTKDYNFSFSGLKTAALYLTRNLGAKKTRRLRPLIAKEFQNAAIEVLVKKTVRAAKNFKARTVILGGGVAANKLLRKQLGKTLKKEIPNSKFLVPDLSLCGDNALIIALAAYFSGKKKAPNKVGANANARLGT